MNGRILFRYTNEAVGALVLIAVIVFIAAVLQTGYLRNWFEPGVKIKVILPKEGSYGLSRGAEVRILGTKAGTVEQVVVMPDQQIHAVVDIKKQMTEFVRSDSEAIIRKEFGVAGASFLEITNGKGQGLDWKYAVISATAERAPTESVGELLSEVRTKVMPILDDAQQLLVNLNSITGKISGGEGTIGKLLVEDQMAIEVETLLGQVNDNLGKLAPMLDSLQTVVGNVSTLSSQLTSQASGLPELSQDAGKILVSFQSVMEDLSRTTPQLPKLVETVNTAAGDVPILVVQTQQVLGELEQLLRQLNSHWLLGGSDTNGERSVKRISPLEVAP